MPRCASAAFNSDSSCFLSPENERATKVAYNEKTKILEVKDFSKEPVTLRDVRLETSERTAFARYYQPAPPK